MDTLRERWSQGRERWPIASVVGPATLGLALPLILAVVALSGRRWYPVLDLVMTEIRIRDVGTRQTPLIGLPGRIGEFPDQGSHPGPLSFWLLAPGYRLFGGSAWAMEASTAALQTVWIGLSLWIAQRRGGMLAIAVTSAAIAVLIRGYGLSVLTQPWNPYLPLLAWIVVLLAAWSVIVGDHKMLIPLAIASSFAAQTHIPYLLMAGGLGVGCAALVAVRWWRTDDRETPPRTLLVTAGLFVLLSLAPIVDQVRRDPGNFKRLLDHFGDPPEEAIGFGNGLELLLRHLDVLRSLGGSLFTTERFVELGQESSGSVLPGVVVLIVWVGSVIIARRIGSERARSLIGLHIVVGTTLVLTWVSMSRIFGQTWFYLTLWAWATMVMMVIAVAWTAVLWFQQESRDSPWNTRLALGIVGVVTVSMVVVAPSTDHPEERLGETMGAVVEPTAQALANGIGSAVGPQGRYVVFWEDAHSFGSQGFGLANELDRLGLDVNVYEPWRVPMTSPRVIALADVDAEVIWATGSFVGKWRADERVIEVASIEPRSREELVEFAEERSRLLIDLAATGLDDLLPLVDTNLFGVRIDERISSVALAAALRMIELDQNAAVFIGPPGVSQ